MKDLEVESSMGRPMTYFIPVFCGHAVKGAHLVLASSCFWTQTFPHQHPTMFTTLLTIDLESITAKLD